MMKHLPNNPIQQEIKNGKGRLYAGPIYWNYGFIPQTWENPAHIHDEAMLINMPI